MHPKPAPTSPVGSKRSYSQVLDPQAGGVNGDTVEQTGQLTCNDSNDAGWQVTPKKRSVKSSNIPNVEIATKMVSAAGNRFEMLQDESGQYAEGHTSAAKHAARTDVTLSSGSKKKKTSSAARMSEEAAVLNLLAEIERASDTPGSKGLLMHSHSPAQRSAACGVAPKSNK